MQPNDYSLLSRITRDVSEGVLVLDMTGTVVYTNPITSQLLGTTLPLGSKYAAFMASDTAANDSFHQYLLDSIYDKSRTHGGELEYTCPDGSKRFFHVVTAFLFGEDGIEQQGVVISISDITQLHRAHQQHRDAAIVFITFLGMLSVCNFLNALWLTLGKPIPSYQVTMLVEAIGLIACFLAIRFSSLSISNNGLRFRGTGKFILLNSAITGLLLAVMLGVKLILQRKNIISPQDPLFYWNLWAINDTIYPLTVVVQEFMTRSIAHEYIRQVIPGKHANAIAIAVSSLFFGGLHLYLGLPYMLGAAFLLAFFGIIYSKQHTIWSLCIPHYVLGLAIKIVFGANGL